MPTLLGLHSRPIPVKRRLLHITDGKSYYRMVTLVPVEGARWTHNGRKRVHVG